MQASDEKELPSGFYCYIVECADGSFYTGWTTNPKRRVREHNKTIKGARYTRTRRPVRLVYVESQTNRSTAMRRELQLKRLSHAKKRKLVQQSLLSQSINQSETH